MRPVVVARDTAEVVALYLPDGGYWRGAETLDGRTLRVPWERWKLSEPKRWYNHVLRLYVPGEAYSIALAWTAAWHFLFWYVNVEEPLRPTEAGFDYMDWTLDVIVSPDRKHWVWKDEAELAEAVRRGVYSAVQATRIREAAENGLARLVNGEPPFDGRWQDWRPEPAWGVPRLPEPWG
jgi:hypothetical protein